MTTKRRRHRINYLKTVLIATAVVLFWRGTWGILDLLIFPNNPVVSYLASFVLGIGILAATHKFVKELA